MGSYIMSCFVADFSRRRGTSCCAATLLYMTQWRPRDASVRDVAFRAIFDILDFIAYLTFPGMMGQGE
jgi:hypothetical protein